MGTRVFFLEVFYKESQYVLASSVAGTELSLHVIQCYTMGLSSSTPVSLGEIRRTFRLSVEK